MNDGFEIVKFWGLLFDDIRSFLGDFRKGIISQFLTAFRKKSNH